MQRRTRCVHILWARESGLHCVVEWLRDSISLFLFLALLRSSDWLIPTIGSDYLRSLCARFSENCECVRNDDNDRSYLRNRRETTAGWRGIKRVFTVFLVKADVQRNVGNAFYFFFFFFWNIYPALFEVLCVTIAILLSAYGINFYPCPDDIFLLRLT